MKSFQFTIDGRKYETTVNEIEDNIAEVTVNGTVFHVAIDKKKTTPSIKPVAPKASAAAPAAPVAPKAAPAPQPAPAAAPAAPKAAEAPAGGKKVVSPLPGSIIKVAVTEGQAVKRGDLLLTLESMKMENQVLAEFDGTVTKIAVTAGQNVMQDDLLVVLG